MKQTGDAGILDASVCALQLAPDRQIAWIVQATSDGKFHSIRTDAFRFRDTGEFLTFWRMVTSGAGTAVHPNWRRL